MKNKLFILGIAICLVFVASLTVSAAKVTELTTGGENYGFHFVINDEGVEITGKIQHEDVHYLAIMTDMNYIVNISPDVKFSTTISLPDPAKKKATVSVYVGEELNSEFTGIFFGEDIILECIDEKWYFTVDDKVFGNNKQWLSGWVDPTLYLDKFSPNAVKMVTASVIDGVEGDYNKAEAIHRWVADNIYYDKDFALSLSATTSLTPVEVLTSRVSVCEGYAKLTVAMLNSAGIPAFTVEGYSLGAGEPDAWTETNGKEEANHMWVEAYVDGKWIVMDPTWDSKNMFYNGIKEKNPSVVYRHFDIDVNMLSATHRIISRPNTFGKMGVSDWALSEVVSAYSLKLIPEEIYSTMKDKMSREEFCDLIVNMISVKLGKTMDEILEEKGLVLNYQFFKDRVDYNILAANALGIVNGKENNMFDADGSITRQEAAVMLQRAAKVLGAVEPNGTKAEFLDASTFPSWSASAIDFVSASVSAQGSKVMGGVENNKFNPTGFYTKEQSVLTVYRLFNTY